MAREPRSATTELLWQQLPQYLRDADDATLGDLYGYVSIWGEHLHDVVDVILSIEADPSLLADPATIPPEWMGWLRAVINYRPTTVAGAGLGATPIDRQRVRMADPRRLVRGSQHAIRERVLDLWPAATSTAVIGHWRGNPWLIAVATDPAEVPDTGTFITTWDELEETFGCWADMEAVAPTWDARDAVDRIHLLVARACRAEQPAGCRIVHVRRALAESVVGASSVVGSTVDGGGTVTMAP